MAPFAARYRDHALAVALAVALFGAALLVAPFVPALLWALTLTILTAPLSAWVARRLGRFGPTLGAFVGVLAAMVGIVLPFVVLGLAVAGQLRGLSGEIDGLDEYARQIDEGLKPYLARVGIRDFATEDYLRDHRDDLLQGVRAPATSFAQSLGMGLFTLIVALLTQFFMLRDGHRLKEPAFQLSPVPPERLEALLMRLQATVRAVFMGTVLVSILQATIMAAFYAFLDVPNALLLGVVMAAVGLIPLIGAPFVYVPVAIGLAAGGRTREAVMTLLFGMIVVSNVDNLLKPFLIGGPTQLHPISVFFAALGGVALIGPVGVVAGPMLLVIVLFLTDVLRERLAADGR